MTRARYYDSRVKSMQMHETVGQKSAMQCKPQWAGPADGGCGFAAISF